MVRDIRNVDSTDFIQGSLLTPIAYRVAVNERRSLLLLRRTNQYIKTNKTGGSFRETLMKTFANR